MKGPITALWAGLHMHAAGKGIWTQHFRGLEELPRLGHKARYSQLRERARKERTGRERASVCVRVCACVYVYL